MKKYSYKKLIVAGWLSLSSIGAIAAETTGGETHSVQEGHEKHKLGIFAGVTHEDDGNHETLGIEYTYRINHSWSLGGVIERAEREKDSTLVMVFAHWWPYKEWYLGAGIGRKDPGNERENTLRATIGYEFELGSNWVLSPQVNLDVIEGSENEEVYGIAFGKKF